MKKVSRRFRSVFSFFACVVYYYPAKGARNGPDECMSATHGLHMEADRSSKVEPLIIRKKVGNFYRFRKQVRILSGIPVINSCDPNDADIVFFR